MIDDLLGIVNNVGPSATSLAEPSQLQCYTAVVADLSRATSWKPDLVGGGLAFDRESARNAALGEAIERYCGNIHVREPLKCSLDEAAERYGAVIHPQTVVQFTDAQYAHTEFPFVTTSNHDSIDWELGHDLITGETVAAPAAAVRLNYYRSHPDEARRTPVLLPGIAAGVSINHATESALLELFERDATAQWWICGRKATRLTFGPRSKVPELCSLDPTAGVELDWLLLHGPSKIPIVACVLVDTSLATLQVGFAARTNIENAALKAAAEAFQLRRLAAQAIDPKSELWSAVESERIDFPLRKFRDDRRYSRTFRYDWSDMTQLVHNLQYYLDPHAYSAAYRKISATVDHDLHIDGTYSINEDSPTAASEAVRLGLSTSVFDVTTSDARDAGYSVIRVIAPQLVANMPTAYPPLGHPTIAAFRAELNLAPLPHS